MSRWFRHYAGMMRDDKLVRVAIRSGQTIERVVWVWAAILESAAEIDDNGRYDFDAAEAAYFLRADQADVDAIEAGLAVAGRVDSGCVVKWGDRQFKSDRSASRQADYRERKRSENGRSDDSKKDDDGGVTSLSRHRDAPETETELDTEVTPLAPRKRGKGATVIPKDWVACMLSDLTPKARACAEQWTRASYETVAEGFALYWQRTGKTTKDWHAAWCGWIIREHAKVMRDQKFGNAAPSINGKAASNLPPEQVEANRKALANIYDMQGRGDEAAQLRRQLAQSAVGRG